MTESALPQVAASVCPRCGSGFRCGMVAGDRGCWCAGLPPLATLPVPVSTRDESAVASTPAASSLTTGASCFCPACLKLLTESSPR